MRHVVFLARKVRLAKAVASGPTIPRPSYDKA